MKLYWSTWTPFTISEATERNNREVDVDISEACIKAIMKEICNLS